MNNIFNTLNLIQKYILYTIYTLKTIYALYILKNTIYIIKYTLNIKNIILQLHIHIYIIKNSKLKYAHFFNNPLKNVQIKINCFILYKLYYIKILYKYTQF